MNETWPTTHGDTVEVYSGRRRIRAAWRYRIRARNGRVVEQGSEAYVRRVDCVAAAERHHPRTEET